MPELILMFVCEKQDSDPWPEEQHTTATVMVRCLHCDRHAVGGYWCETCGHSDVSDPGHLAGHGPGRCGDG